MRNKLKISLFAAVFIVSLLAAAFVTDASSGAVSAAKAAYEAKFQKYLASVKQGAPDADQETALGELLEAREAYLGALADEASRLTGAQAEKLRAEIEKIRNISPAALAGSKSASKSGAQKASPASAKTPSSGGAQKSAAVRAGSGAASTASAGLSKVKKTFGEAVSFVSSAVSFVSGYVGDFFASKYDEKKLSTEVARDPAASTKGFTTGVNFPWVRGKYGWDVCVHESWGKGFDAAAIESAFAKFRSKKFTVVRWFLYCNGVANPKMDASGRFLVPEKEFFDNFDTVMRLAKKYDQKLVWSLLDFHWFMKDSPKFEKYSKIAKDPVLLENFIQAAVIPLAKKYADDESIYAWEIINEPEWVTAGVSYPGAPGALTVDELKNLVRKVTGAIHSVSSRPVTVGSAFPKWLPLYVGTGIDIYQAHYYDKGVPIAKKSFSAAEFKKKYGLSNKVVLGEFASKGSRYTIAQYINMAREAGYDGAWVWGYFSDDESTSQKAIDATPVRY